MQSFYVKTSQIIKTFKLIIEIKDSSTKILSILASVYVIRPASAGYS